MNSVLKSSIVAVILSISLQPAVHANNDDVIVDYCAHYADRVAKGERFIDYPNAGLMTTITDYAVRGGMFLAAALITSCIVAQRQDRVLVALAPLAVAMVGEEVGTHFSMLDLSFKRRAKCAALGLIPAYHNVKKDTPAEASSEEL
jgi:hypothetical protein